MTVCKILTLVINPFMPLIQAGHINREFRDQISFIIVHLKSIFGILLPEQNPGLRFSMVTF